MILDSVLLIVSIVLVLWGADRFTDGASGMARRWNVSELVIGLTIVSMGTSLPEFVVSFMSALKGSADMSIGNIVGSNIFNTIVIVGASALMMSMTISRGVLHRDIPITIGSALILWFLCSKDGYLDFHDGGILLIVFGLYLGYTYYIACQKDDEPSEEVSQMGWGRIVIYIIIGLACLVFAGRMLVDSASSLALAFGMSERMVGLTILAAGTSFPELATSVMAARKGSKGLALGNALGSNVFNICFVVGVSAIVSPLHIHGISEIDWFFLMFSGGLLLLLGFWKRRFGRVEGAIMLAAYVLYLLLIICL